MRKIIGAHLSIAKGIYQIQNDMESLGAKTCAIFLKNQRRYSSSPLKESAIKLFKRHVIHPDLIVPHASYLINFANPDLEEKSMECMLDDLERCRALGIKLYNMHPGSDVKNIGSSCLKSISNNINKAMEKVPDVIILLENTAGQGNTLGRNFEEIKCIIDGINNKERIGVCLDTCHMFAAGFDIRTQDKFSKVIESFDKVVGIKYLKAMHLNDSKEPLGSNKDRHECIGKGFIGEEAFKFIMNSEVFNDIPMVLETPNPNRYKQEIELLKSYIIQ